MFQEIETSSMRLPMYKQLRVILQCVDLPSAAENAECRPRSNVSSFNVDVTYRAQSDSMQENPMLVALGKEGGKRWGLAGVEVDNEGRKTWGRGGG